jgi:hypothetical protein
MERTLRDELGVADARVVGRLEACVRAESLWGALRGEANWLFVLLDGDISGAVCVDGHVLRGANGLAGGLGGLVVEREGAAGSRERARLARSVLLGARPHGAGTIKRCFVRRRRRSVAAGGRRLGRARRLRRVFGPAGARRGQCRRAFEPLARRHSRRAGRDRHARFARSRGVSPGSVLRARGASQPPSTGAHFGADAAVMGAIAFAVEARS